MPIGSGSALGSGSAEISLEPHESHAITTRAENPQRFAWLELTSDPPTSITASAVLFEAGGIATYEPTPVYRKAWATSAVTSSTAENLFLVNPSPTERETVRVTFRDGQGSSCSASIALAPLGDGAFNVKTRLPCALATQYYGHIELEGQNGFSGLMLVEDGSRGLAIRNFVELPAAAGSDAYKPLGLWRISDGSVGFYVNSSLGCLSVSNRTVSGVQYTVHSSKWQSRSGAGGAWADVPNSGHAGGVCAYSPTEPGQYRGVAEISVDGERGTYASSNILTVGGEDGSSGGQPSFGSATVADRTFTAGTAIASVGLPAASGGDGTLTYGLTPTVPGLNFSASSRILSGTPSTAGTYSLTYSARDADGDTVTLSFTVTVRPQADLRPSFGSARVSSQSYMVGTAISPLTLPAASGGDGTLTYRLSPTVPGLNFSTTSRRLSGTPSNARSYAMTYTARDADGDTATLRFTIIVEASGGSSEKSFNAGQRIPDMPTGFWFPGLIETGLGASFVSSSGTVTVAWSGRRGRIQYRGITWTCASGGGCEVVNGTVTRGTVVQTGP